MELYLEPTWVKKGPKFKKGHKPWNKGRKGFSTVDDTKRKRILSCLAEGRRHLWEKRDRNVVHNQIPTCVYDLGGNFLGAYLSEAKAAEAFGQIRENVSSCVRGERKRVGNYQFRRAKVEVFRGEMLVKRTPIEPYKRGSRHKLKIIFTHQLKTKEL